MLALATQEERALARLDRRAGSAGAAVHGRDAHALPSEAYGARARLFFVMGADSWEEITTWREWERVLTLTDQLVVTRPGYELATGHVTDEIRERIVDVRGATREEIEQELERNEAGRAIYLTRRGERGGGGDRRESARSRAGLGPNWTRSSRPRWPNTSGSTGSTGRQMGQNSPMPESRERTEEAGARRRPTLSERRGGASAAARRARARGARRARVGWRCTRRARRRRSTSSSSTCARWRASPTSSSSPAARTCGRCRPSPTRSQEQLRKQLGVKPARVEGYNTAEWVLLDYGDFIFHVFEEKARRFYDLERLWRDAARVAAPGRDPRAAGAGARLFERRGMIELVARSEAMREALAARRARGRDRRQRARHGRVGRGQGRARRSSSTR